MATNSKPNTAKYVVLRDFGGNLAGDVLDLDPDNAADLVRDGFVQPQTQE